MDREAGATNACVYFRGRRGIDAGGHGD